MKKLFAVLLTLTMLLIICACGTDPAPSGQQSGDTPPASADSDTISGTDASTDTDRPVQHLSLGTSAVGGTYYIWGGGWATIMNEHVPGADISVEATGGPQTNLQLMEQGDMELSFLTSWAAGEAWDGLNWAEGTNYRSARTMFPMYSSALYIIARKDSSINSMSDLGGMNVATGPAGSSSDLAGRAILETLGIEPRQLTAITASAQKDGLKDGTLDAIMVVNGTPSSVVLELETTHDLKFIGYTEEELSTILDAYPFWATEDVPADTYKNQPEPITAISLWNVCSAHKDLDSDFVYDMVKATFEYHDNLVAVDQTAATCVPENIIYASTPLHPGAYRYYQEIGIDIPDNLKPVE